MLLRRGRWLTLVLLILAAVLAPDAWSGEKKWAAEGYWLPEAASSYADEVDSLFYFILYLTGAVFVGTQICLVAFLVLYRHRPDRKGYYTHGNHRAEVLWTIIPAVLLGGIAIIQSATWNHIKRDVPVEDRVEIQMLAQQFSWNFRYPGLDGEWGTDDDITTNNELVVPVRKNIVIEQTSKDVIHSLFLPYMRLKQDVVPGLHTKVWFKPTKTTQTMRATRPPYTNPETGAVTVWDYEIVCAELCGIGHGNMRGKLVVLNQQEYDEWVQRESRKWAARIAMGKERDRVWRMWPVDTKGNRIYFEEDLKVVRDAAEAKKTVEEARRKAEDGEGQGDE